jgi:hypothetical protein
VTLRYTDDKKELIRLARDKGLSNEEIMKALVANEYGDQKRLQIILDYAPYLDLTDADARALVVRSGLVRR